MCASRPPSSPAVSALPAPELQHKTRPDSPPVPDSSSAPTSRHSGKQPRSPPCPDHHDPIFDKPAPRPPRTAAESARIQAQNRRRAYLEQNPGYFDDLDHELAEPLLYERLVKGFQTAAERQAEGQAKGYGRILEASLARGEQRLAQPRPDGTASADDGDDDSPWYGDVVDKQHGRQLWRDFLTERFVRGRDIDFDYALVDDDVGLDVLAERDAQDAWFDDEDPSWDPAKVDRLDEEALKQRRGDTGIQDF